MTILAKLAVMTAAPSFAIALFAAMPTAEAATQALERNDSNVTVGSMLKMARAGTTRTRQMRMRTGNSVRNVVKTPRSRIRVQRTAPRRMAPANQFKARMPAPPPPTGPSNLTAKPRVLKDLYCGGEHQVACDYVFTNYCKLIGGTMSPSGTTCYHPWEW